MKFPETRRRALEVLEGADGIILPTVVETTHKGERHWSLFDRLLKDRIVFLGNEIDDTVANIVIAQLLFLESEDPDKEIMLYVNSPGGVVYAGLAIYDTMNHVRAPVSTTCIGMAASMASLILCSGEKGHRAALPNARILIHQPHGGAKGQVSDIEIQAREVKYLKDTVIDIYARNTGQSRDTLLVDMDRDKFMSPGLAKEYGLIDSVVMPRDREKTD